MNTTKVTEIATKSDTFNTHLTTITPDDAARWMKQNKNNRPVNQARVDAYARDMTEQRFQLNGATICFDNTGRMTNGQHRLLASMKSNTSFTTLVVTGLSPEAHSTLDTGQARTFGQHLRWSGEANSDKLAAAIHFCWRFDNQAIAKPHLKPSQQELESWLERNPLVRVSLKKSGPWFARLPLSSTAVAGPHYLTSRVGDETSADLFFSSLVDGTNLEEGSPILALRRWLDRAASRREKPEPHITQGTVLKALNYFREGRSIEMIRFAAGGAGKEAFPKVWEAI